MCSVQMMPLHAGLCAMHIHLNLVELSTITIPVLQMGTWRSRELKQLATVRQLGGGRVRGQTQHPGFGVW